MAKPERWSAAKLREYVNDAGDQRKRWSAAKPTECECGRVHPSKMEARVCRRLHLEAEARGETLYQQVSFPLFSLAPGSKDAPMRISVDFILVRDGRMVRAIDAKSRRVSPEWKRGARAFEATYNLKLEEVDR